jgi:hypothetical protein
MSCAGPTGSRSRPGRRPKSGAPGWWPRKPASSPPGAHQADVALVDGTPGIVVAPAGRLLNVLRVTIAGGRITALDVIADPARLELVRLEVFGVVGSR